MDLKPVESICGRKGDEILQAIKMMIVKNELLHIYFFKKITFYLFEREKH